jgi:hypothetical protein
LHEPGHRSIGPNDDDFVPFLDSLYES